MAMLSPRGAAPQLAKHGGAPAAARPNTTDPEITALLRWYKGFTQPDRTTHGSKVSAIRLLSSPPSESRSMVVVQLQLTLLCATLFLTVTVTMLDILDDPDPVPEYAVLICLILISFVCFTLAILVAFNVLHTVIELPQQCVHVAFAHGHKSLQLPNVFMFSGVLLLVPAMGLLAARQLMLAHATWVYGGVALAVLVTVCTIFGQLNCLSKISSDLDPVQGSAWLGPLSGVLKLDVSRWSDEHRRTLEALLLEQSHAADEELRSSPRSQEAKPAEPRGQDTDQIQKPAGERLPGRRLSMNPMAPAAMPTALSEGGRSSKPLSSMEA